MPSNNIISLIVVDSGVSVHQLSEEISTDMREISTEESAHIRLEPIHTRHELVDVVELIPFQYITMVDQCKYVGLLVFNVGNWPEPKVFVDKRFDDCVVL